MPDQETPSEHVHATEEREAVESLWSVFRERAISIGTLNRPLRLIVGLAIAQLVVAAILVAGRDHMHPLVPVFAGKDGVVEMPVFIFVVSIVLLVAAWAYVLAGSFHANRLLQVLILVAYTGVLSSATIDRHAWAAPLHRALLAAVWLLAAGLAVHDRWRAHPRQRSHRQRFRGLTFLVLLALVGGYYLVGWLDARENFLLAYTSAISLQLQTLSVVLVPVLFLAGIDFAEWGEVVSSRAAALGARLGRPRLLALVSAAAALAIAAGQAYQYRRSGAVIAGQLAMGTAALALLGLLFAAARLRGDWRPRLPYAAFAAAAAVFLGALMVPALMQAIPQYQSASKRANASGGFALTTYEHAREPKFSIQYPQLWDASVTADSGPAGPTLVTFDGTSHAGDPAAFWLARIPGISDPDVTPAFASWLNGCCSKHEQIEQGPPRQDGAWLVEDYTLTAESAPHTKLRGQIWLRHQGDVLWLMQAQTGDVVWNFHQGVFKSMRASFAAEELGAAAGAGPAAPVAAAEPSSNRLIGLAAVVWAGVALVALVALFALARRPGNLGLSALFLAVAATLFAFESAPALADVAFGRHPAWLTSLRLPGLQLSLALATLIATAAVLLRRRVDNRAVRPLVLLFVLNLSLQVCSWVSDLYSTAQDVGGRFTIAQAVVILAAMLWDITMSGESITNHGGRWFPRHARVLIFFGYLMLVSCAVLYFSSLHVQVSGERLESQFESDVWPQSGVLILGVPMLLTVFLLELRGWRRAAAAGTAPERHHGSQAEIAG